MLHDTFAVVLGSDGCTVMKLLTMLLVDRVRGLLVLRENLGFRMNPMLVLDWHVSVLVVDIFVNIIVNVDIGRRRRRTRSSAWAPPTTTTWTRWCW